MAKITIVGNAAVVTSTLKKEDIDLVAKRDKDALILKGGEDGKETLFVISDGTTGGINNFGVTFNGKTRDENGFATLTMEIPADCPDAKEYVAETYGVALAKLNALEAKLPAAVESIKADKAAVLQSIIVAG